MGSGNRPQKRNLTTLGAYIIKSQGELACFSTDRNIEKLQGGYGCQCKFIYSNKVFLGQEGSEGTEDGVQSDIYLVMVHKFTFTETRVGMIPIKLNLPH